MVSSSVAFESSASLKASDRITSKVVQIQFIDFEDAVPFGLLIKYPKNYWNHRYYPDFHRGAESDAIVAVSRHNDFFLQVISSWLCSENQDLSFESFMCSLTPEDRYHLNSSTNVTMNMNEVTALQSDIDTEINLTVSSQLEQNVI